MSEHSNPSNIYDRFAQVTKQTHDLVAPGPGDRINGN